MKTILAFLLLCTAVLAVDYDIIYIRAPNVGTRAPLLQDFRNQVDCEPGASLMLLHPDGSEEVLFAPPDPNGGVFDPCPDVTATCVYFAYTVDGTTTTFQRYPGPTHIYKINVATREVVQLTHDSDDQPLAPDTKYGDRLKLHNTAPCPLPDGRVIFTSNRNRLLRTPLKGVGEWSSGVIEPVFQLFAMDADGRNVEQIDHRSLRGALHPFLLKDGRIAFSSLENHGLRTKPDQWWTLLIANPDLSHWEPSFSYGGQVVNDLSGMHFAGQDSSGNLYIEDYYPGKDGGVTGAIYRWPVNAPHGNPNRVLNPMLSAGSGGRRFPFQPIGAEVTTPWGNHKDSGTWGAGHPSGAPGGDMLIVRGHAAKPTPWASTRGVVECGIYLMPGGNAPLMTDLVVLKDDPAFWELQPKALVPFDQIYGAMPPVIPRTPNPSGEPFAYVGTSGVYARESARFGNNNDDKNPDVWVQGGDVGTYSNADIHAIRILVQYPTPHRGQSALWDVHGVERMSVLGEIPLRKFDAMGQPILDSNGDPDTSFKAKIPADTSFTFQLIDQAGQVLTHSMTWHQLRPGEVRTDCRGCHAHHQPGIEFEGTFASRPEYEPVDLSHAAPVHVEWFRDVKPILDAHCAECHTDPANESGVVIDDNFRSHTAVKHFKSRISTLLARLTDPDTATRMPKGADPLTAAEIKTIATWIDLGSGRADAAGLYWQDNLRPTLTVEASTAGLKVGAYDVDSGPVTVAATLDGQPLTLTQAGDVWTHGALTGAEVTVTATDTAGNVARMVRTVGEPTDPPDPPDPPLPPLTDRQRIERLEVEVFGEIYPGGGTP